MLRDLVGFAAAYNSMPRTPGSGVEKEGSLYSKAITTEPPMSLIRQEVEGGMLYVDALMLSLEGMKVVVVTAYARYGTNILYFVQMRVMTSGQRFNFN